MPLFFSTENDNTLLGVWEITETVEELQLRLTLSDSEKEKYSKFRTERRKKEWLTTRVLLNKLLPDNPGIKYTTVGKPYLPGINRSFSLSHSQKFVAIILSESSSCGIDIEDTSRKIENVARKFLSEEEWQNIGENDRIKKLFLHWCGKETIFKLIDESGIEFSKQILLSPITQLQNQGQGQIIAQYKNEDQSLRINLNYLFIKEHALTWATI